MAKIKVTSKCEIYDGMSLTFRAPCDCAAVDGLNVYYNGKSQSFVFKDTIGNSLDGVDDLFTEGAYIKVILDTGNGYAYLQNHAARAFSVGDIKTTARTDLNDNWVLCNGAFINAAKYPGLAALFPVGANDSYGVASPAWAASQGSSTGIYSTCVAPDGTVFTMTGTGTTRTIRYSKDYITAKSFQINFQSAGWSTTELNNSRLSLAVTEDRLYVATEYISSGSRIGTYESANSSWRPVVSYIGWDGEKTVGSWTHHSIGTSTPSQLYYYPPYGCRLMYNGNGAFFLGLPTSGGNGYWYRFPADFSTCAQASFGCSDTPCDLQIMGENHMIYTYQESGYYGRHYVPIYYDASTNKLVYGTQIMGSGNGWTYVSFALKDDVLYWSYTDTSSGDSPSYYYGNWNKGSSTISAQNASNSPVGVFSYNNEVYCTVGNEIKRIVNPNRSSSWSYVSPGADCPPGGTKDVKKYNGCYISSYDGQAGMGGTMGYYKLAVPKLPSISPGDKLYAYIKGKG